MQSEKQFKPNNDLYPFEDKNSGLFVTLNSVQIIIPTLNAIKNTDGFTDNFKKIVDCGYDVLVVDSSSSDGTVEEVKRLGAEVLTIPRREFNHGVTRELVRKQSKKDIVVFMTQDVEVVSTDFVRSLIEPLFSSEDIVVSYARQIPLDGADIFEAFPRKFNYPEHSHVRSLDDVDKYGIYTFFCSNSCAAYRNSALDEIGGFDALMNSEEYFAVAKLLDKGYRIAYVAESIVKHSHSYSLSEGFRRYFDIGYVRAQYPRVQKIVGGAESRGKNFAKELILQLIKNQQIHLVPYAIVQFATKWLGYRMGHYGHYLPTVIKKKFSAQPEYWSSKYLS